MPSFPQRSYAHLPQILDVPDLIEVQKESFRWFQEEGLKDLLEEISPIRDFTGSRLELTFVGYEFRPGRDWKTETECRQRDLTYSVPLYVRTKLLVKTTGEIKEQDLFFGDIPLMTSKGVFITSGIERVVVSQLLRSPGVYFTTEEDATSGRILCHAKLIPTRGAWLEFETSSRNVISAKINGKRKIPITTLLRAIGYGSDDKLLSLFAKEENSAEHQYINSTLDREPGIKDESAALIDIYRRLRPGDPPNVGSAQKLVKTMFFDPQHYDLGEVGRYKLNMRLRPESPKSQRALSPEDIVEIIRHIILINNGQDKPDDIDHLGNRRVRTVGELIQNRFRIGLLRLQRVAIERMSIINTEAVTPSALVNVRPVVAAIREFFGGSQLSQFMDQTNPLAELTHKRRLSAMGPGGLSRERAGFDVRDVHYSHYGRICPIETPEGPNIGLIGSLAAYGRISRYGFIETPYRRVANGVSNGYDPLLGETTRESVFDKTGKIIVEAGATINTEHLNRLSQGNIRIVPLTDRVVYISPGYKELQGKTLSEAVLSEEGNQVAKANTVVSPALVKKLSRLPAKNIRVLPFVSDEIIYLSADQEDRYVIAQANARLDEKSNQFLDDKIEVRLGDSYTLDSPDRIDFMDVSPKQIFSVGASLIPFLEHDDANRALMGSNMQRQAVPLLRPEAPLVATGMESVAARYSGQALFIDDNPDASGVVSSVTGFVDEKGNLRYHIIMDQDNGKQKEYELMKFVRTNQGTCINQIPIVNKGDRVEAGQPLADSSAIEQGELALGQNVLCAFMSWEGYNFEDAIIISSRLVENDKFTSIHIEKYEAEARETKLGPEEITRDIPNVGEESLRDLDENGIIHIGAKVNPDDILVGKITPKGETELSAEEKLLRAIFGEKAREVKDTSLRIPPGEWGKVINSRHFSVDRHVCKKCGHEVWGERPEKCPACGAPRSEFQDDDLPAGVREWIQVWVAQKRRVSVGDKLSGRHGNKGVVSIIAPKEDMPFLPDGTPIDIILNPIGVPSRMNIGQVMETHLGWAAQILGFRAITPVFDGADEEAIQDALARAWIAQKAGAVSLDHDNNNGSPPIEIELARAWVASHGYDSEKVFSDHKDDAGVASNVCLRLWLEELGIASREIQPEELTKVVEKVSAEKRQPAPIIGKVILRDGHTGEPFDQPVTVGQIYMMKLNHLVEDKVHARSTGPYSLISQQPLGGKAQFGGQRFGEMEVWTLEAYGAAHNLQEILTIKSDDVTGRAKTYEAIVKNEDIVPPGVPESFKVLIKELQSLGLAVEVMKELKAPEIHEITEGREGISEDTDSVPDLTIDAIKEEVDLDDRR
ncbi:MAG: DNA-directed RNA polymerase subunit beta [Chloroflexota bacterium]